MGLIPIFCSILILRVQEAKRILSCSNNAVVIATDTVFGILSISKETIERVKEREPGVKKIVKLIGNIERLGNNIPEDLRNIAEKFWPGALTIIYGGVGYRIPNDVFLLELLKDMDYIYASSANITNNKTITSLEEARNIFKGEGVFFIENEFNIRSNRASTVFDYDNLKILREGDISEEDIFTLVQRI